MWRTALLAALAAVAVATPTPSQAQEGAWCSREDVGEGTVAERCHFETFEECRAVGGGLATTMCTRNPRYVAPQPARSDRNDRSGKAPESKTPPRPR
jgi:Protein of unknown function (DUF3551)